MSTSNSDLLMRQFGRVNSAKQLSADWEFSQSASSSVDSDETEERKLAVLIEWLNTILPDLKLQPKASADELRDSLADGTVLLQVLRKVKPRSITKELEGALEAEVVSREQNVKLFLDSIDERGIPKFEMGDLEKGSMKRVVDCLLSIRVRYPTGRNNFSSSNGRMTRSGSLREFSPYQTVGPFSSSLSSPGAERQPLYAESKFQQFLRTSPALSESSAAWMHHAGHRFHEVFQRVACLLRKVVQEIERRISTQAEHLRTQNNLFKAREEKYQSRIRVLETLASATGEETGVIIDQLPPIKGVKVKIEEKSKVNEEIVKLMKEKEQASLELVRLRQELETTKTIYDDMVKLMKQKEDIKHEHEPQTKTEISELKHELEEGKKELNHFVNSMREMDQSRNEKQNAEVVALQKELDSAKKELDDIVGSRKDGGDDVVRFVKEKDDMSLEIATLKQELERVTRHEDNGDGDVARLVKEKDEKSLEIATLRQELERVTRQGSVGDGEVARLVKEKEETSLELATLKQELERITRQGLSGDGEVARLVKEEDMRLELSTLKQELQRVHGQEHADADAARLEKEKEEMSLELATLKQELERVRGDDMARLEKEKEETSLELVTLKQELERVKGQANADKDADVARLTKENEEMSVKILTLQQGNDADVARLMKENEELSLKISTLQQNNDADVARLMKENEEMSLKISTLQHGNDADVARLMKENEEMSLKITTLEQELERTRREHEDEASRLDSTRKELDETARLVKEKDQANLRLAISMQELKVANKAQEQKCLHLETEGKMVKDGFEKKVKDLQGQLESSQQSWSMKQNSFSKSVNLQFHALRELRFSSTSIKQEVLKVQQDYNEKFLSLGVKLKTLVDASENYYLVLAENRRLFNELQDLRGELVVCNPAKAGKDGRKLFRFNRVYGPEATQAEVYLDTQPLVQSVLDGYNVCIFAYGQTGSGKTYTMLGPDGAKEEDWGVNYRALKDLFNMSKGRSDTIAYEVGVQMVEIYNEQVRDLLTNDPQKKYPFCPPSFTYFILVLLLYYFGKSNGIAVPDATMLSVSSTSGVMDLMQIGLNNRAVSATALNERSSRSHSVLSVHVKGKDLQAGTSLFGNLHLVDLAGSERIDRSEVTGDRLKEAQHINKSLSALGDVIFALAQKSTHIPFRNSKLTQLLQSSLGGQAKTLMFVQLNPDSTSFSESLSTLKFAERVTGIELGAAKSNPGRDVKELMEQLASLKDTIANKDEEIERLVKNNPAPVTTKLRTRKSASGEKGLGLTENVDHDQMVDSERYSDNMSDGENSVGTPDSAHDDGGGGGGGKGVKKTSAATSSSTLQKPISSSRPRRP
ncbi:Kinesin-like protein KIN-14P [Linum perenne]